VLVVITVFDGELVDVAAVSGIDTIVTEVAVVVAVPRRAVREVSLAELRPPLSPELRPSRNDVDSPAMARAAASAISQRLGEGLDGGGGGSSDTSRYSQTARQFEGHLYDAHRRRARQRRWNQWVAAE
jgi:hypothetical protein